MSVTQASLLGDTFGSNASGTIPIGGIIMWSGSIATIPTGWALCNGSGGTPDLRERFIVGAGGDNPTVAGTTGYSPGDNGGANSVGLTIAQIPSHNHNFNDPGHSHQLYNQIGGPGNSVGGGGSNTSDSQSGPNTTGITFNAQGGGEAHENRPPYYALAFIMRVS
jgi:microcystin-dependent protein